MSKKTITITEALAELKTLDKRIKSKRAFVSEHLMFPSKMRDPLEKQGGSASLINSERQAIIDLTNHMVSIRMEIGMANNSNTIKIGEMEQTITEWLIWRRDVLPGQLSFLKSLFRSISETRDSRRTRRTPEEDTDYVVNLDERALQEEIEMLEGIEGELDGQLSLKNATVTVTV